MTRPAFRSDAHDAPAISVVVSTYQRSGRLPGLVTAFEKQRFDGPFEVIVVDDGSDDDTWTTLQRLERESNVDLRPVRSPANRGPSSGRNLGWRVARAPLVAFTDDDCRPDPDWLATLVDAFAGADIVQGCTLPDPEQADRWGPFSRSLEVTSEKGFYETCNMAYRREWLERLGGFDERFRFTGEDTDLAWRGREAGARTTFEKDAVVYHEVSASDWKGHLREKLRWVDPPLVAKLHPHLRTELYHGRWFWRPSHAEALKALAGLTLAAAPGGPKWIWPARAVVGATLARPYFVLRTRTAPPPRSGPRRRVVLLPFLLASDLLEIGVVLRASWRHRTLII